MVLEGNARARDARDDLKGRSGVFCLVVQSTIHSFTRNTRMLSLDAAEERMDLWHRCCGPRSHVLLELEHLGSRPHPSASLFVGTVRASFIPRTIGMDALFLLGHHHPSLGVVGGRTCRCEPPFPPGTVGARLGHRTIGMDALCFLPCHRGGRRCMGHGSTHVSCLSRSSFQRVRRCRCEPLRER